MRGENWTVDCPTCGKPVHYGSRARNPFFPFCSERCKLVDLGKWLAEEHRISEPLEEHREGRKGDTQHKDKGADSP